MYFAVLILFVFVLFIGNFVRKRRRLESRLNDVVCPPTVIPGFGHVFKFLGVTTKDALKYGMELVQQNPGKTLVLWLFHLPHIGIQKPEDIQIVASKFLEKEPRYRFIAELIGDGLITSRVEKWKRNRRIISPTFNATILHNNFLLKFNERNCKLIQKLKDEVGVGVEFDIGPLLMHTFVKTICDTAIGCTEEFNDEEISKLAESTVQASNLIMRRSYQPLLQPSIAFKAYTFLTGLSKLFNEAKQFQMQVLRKKRDQYEERKARNNDNEDDSERVDFVNRLLKANEYKFSVTEMYNEVSTILFAGSETNSLAVGFTLISLALRQDIQNEVHDELKKVFGDSDRHPTIEDLNQLVFLEQCIKESLRRYSIVPMVARQADCDLTLSDGSVILAGECVIVAIIGVHTNPNFYPDPLIWNPHNFDPERVANRHSFSFIPFGFGPRMCLGYKYAMVAAKALLSTLLRSFRVSTNETDVELDMDFLVRTANGFKIILCEKNS